MRGHRLLRPLRAVQPCLPEDVLDATSFPFERMPAWASQLGRRENREGPRGLLGGSQNKTTKTKLKELLWDDFRVNSLGYALAGSQTKTMGIQTPIQ